MLPLSTIIARLAWAALLGAIIGIERNIRRRPSGMRTGVCVSLGAALFTIVSIEIARRTGDSKHNSNCLEYRAGHWISGGRRHPTRARQRDWTDDRRHDFRSRGDGHGGWRRARMQFPALPAR